MKLADDDINARLESFPGWAYADGMLVRSYAFASFADGISFVVRLAFDAEASDHHPDLLVSYKRVTVTWSTHSAGGVTEKDFAGARQSDTIAGG
jgi:4a-hydroxytetrahydrobiopterin dehydratase